MNEITGWFAGRLPDDWFTAAPEVTVDRDEIVVVGKLPNLDDEKTGAARQASEAGRIRRFREDTRRQRMQIADETEVQFQRKVAWGASCGDSREVFTNLSVPVMTRLRQPQRLILDTLVDAGVARSRSEALAWCARLVGQHHQDWIGQLRDALVGVEAARNSGPAA